MPRVFSNRSLANLQDVHPDLVLCVKAALHVSLVDFTVVEGLRTLEKQREYFRKGASRTMKSYHLRQADGFAHAVDLYPFFDGKVQTTAPDRYWRMIAVAMKKVADAIGIRITWGGDWKSFVDMPHYQYEGKANG